MRILLTADPEISVPPKTYGGVQRLVDGLTREYRNLGHTVGLVARADSEAAVDAFYPFRGNDSQAKKDSLLNTLTLLQATKDFQPDILHSFSRLLYLVPMLMSSLPKVMTYGRYPGQKQIEYALFLARSSLLFTGCSDYISHVGQLGGGKWKTVYNFVDIERYKFVSEVPDDAPLVFLSRIEKIKGLHNAIEIAKKSNKKLLIAGNIPDLPDAKEYWNAEIRPHVDGENISYIGPVDDVEKNRLLGSACALVVPIEWNEPFGMVFTEALACGTPVISTSRGGVPEIVRNRIEGYLVENVESGVRAVRDVSSISRAACRKRVEQLFTRQVIASEYLKIYEELLHKE